MGELPVIPRYEEEFFLPSLDIAGIPLEQGFPRSRLEVKPFRICLWVVENVEHVPKFI